jgi:hypothetical protein
MIIFLSVAVALSLGGRAGTPVRHHEAGGREGRGPLRSPLVWLGLVTTAIYLNQVLFTVYVLRRHGGDTEFIARYVPAGWFALARTPALETLARHFPYPGLLAPSVLRVQAFLELPFVVCAYLTVCRWFSGPVYRAARRLVVPVSASYTATFCLIEWSLHNPYTAWDIVIRVAAGIVVPLLATRLSDDAPEAAPTLFGLLLFAASTVAFGLLVLCVYDTALLYNLGHLGGRLPTVVVALTALAVARAAVRFVPATPPGRGMDSIARSFGRFLVLFFVPALPVRYGLGFGAPWLSAAAGLTIVVVAVWQGVRETFARIPGRLTAWILQMAVAVLAGLGGAALGALLPARFAEARLLWAAGAFFGCAVTACSLVDRFGGLRGAWSGRREEASGTQADDDAPVHRVFGGPDRG